jgi:hypothetical protein
MAEDKYKIDKTKPPKPIQLKDASGPHELSDDRNYEFLETLFKMKEADPYAKEAWDVDNVYQLMDENLAMDITNPFKKDTDKWTGYGQYGKHLENLIWDPKGYVQKVFKDYENEKGESRVLKDLVKYRPEFLKGSQGKKDVIAQYDRWNTDQGIGTLLHEMRHKAFANDPVAHKLIDDSQIGEETFTRVLDTKYGDEQTARNARRYIKITLERNGFEGTDENIDRIIKYGINLHNDIMKAKSGD